MFNLLLAAENGAAHAAEQPGVMAPGNWLPGLTALIVFGITFAILAVYVWPKITQALDDRDRKIRDEISSAEEAREEAKAALAQYQSELANAREEANQMIQEARADARRAAEELKAKNKAELANMREKATADIESAKRAAITELHAEAANLATAMASKILQREISSDDQQRLVDESLQELAGGVRS